jgi:hypothetical protein
MLSTYDRDRMDDENDLRRRSFARAMDWGCFPIGPAGLVCNRSVYGDGPHTCPVELRVDAGR